MSSPFFRSPLDESSSSGDTPSGSQDEEDHYAPQNLAAPLDIPVPDNVYDLARTRTAQSGSIEELSQSLPNTHIGADNYDHKDALLHAALEKNCIYEALMELNSCLDPAHGRLYTVEDPEVQERGKQKYQSLAASLATHGISNSGLHRDEYRPLRENYNQVMDVVKGQGDQTLQRKGVKPTRPGLTGLMFRPSSTLQLSGVTTNLGGSAAARRVSSGLGPLRNGHDQPGILARLVGDGHPLLPQSFSMTSFYNVEIIGRGGYGTVFSGYNPIDGGSYAIKQIPLSTTRIRNIQKRGQAELDSLLKEVRAMQSFDHPNIVRYHNAWLERPQEGLKYLSKNPRKLLEFGTSTFSGDLESSEVPDTTSGLEQTVDSKLNLSDHSDGIVFGEDSAPGETEPEIFHLEVPRKRRESHATFSSSYPRSEIGEEAGLSTSFKRQPRKRRESHATLSSSVSKRSFVQSPEEEFDEEILRDVSSIFISGHHEPSFGMNIVFEEEDDPAPPCQTNGAQPPASTEVTHIDLALHIQMALYPLTLADYLKSEPPGCGDGGVTYRHCFHVKPSLQILSAILDGVQYLHSRNMVHRDLKPANIFLSPCEDAYRHKSHVQIGVCKECSHAGTKKDLQIGVRIGDFGLVTELARPERDPQHGPEKAVGTEFYRPPVPSHQPSDKLDVFSLGVIAFELLWKFDTRSERICMLSELKHGKLPALFAHKMDSCGAHLATLIQGMIHTDEHKRLSCLDVQKELDAIIASFDT